MVTYSWIIAKILPLNLPPSSTARFILYINPCAPQNNKNALFTFFPRAFHPKTHSENPEHFESRRHRASSDEEEFQANLNKIPPRPLAQNRTPDGRPSYDNKKRLHHVCALRASAVRMFSLIRVTIRVKPYYILP